MCVQQTYNTNNCIARRKDVLGPYDHPLPQCPAPLCLCSLVASLQAGLGGMRVGVTIRRGPPGLHGVLDNVPQLCALRED